MAHRVHTLQVEAKRILTSARDRNNAGQLAQLVTARVQGIVSKGRHKVAAKHWGVSVSGKTRLTEIRSLLCEKLLQVVHRLMKEAERIRTHFRRTSLAFQALT